ncbi:hypothetical protein HCN44_010973 [Aphidius gifuensis]|uniref:Uncharacterized protein n=1 Tax=Aphidius gifuensis TaxID=684658 RepID=A0A834Y385_APHGI|nr:hypothetical protein HCN44_010973 [Aphidius gifuensis]
MINNEIPVNEPVRENDNETPVDGPGVENEIPADDVMINNEISVNESVRENVNNEIPVDVSGEKNDMAYVDLEYETAAAMFANAQFEVKENEPIDEDFDKFLEDLVQNALEENGREEKMYLEIKKLAITSVKILPQTKRITMNSRKITKKQKEVENNQNGEKHSPELVSESMKLGKKIITLAENQKKRSKDGNTKKTGSSITYSIRETR